MDPKKSFSLPFKVGKKDGKIVLGKYEPTIDSLGILADTKKYKLEHPEDDLFGSNNSWEKATQYHEFSGHAYLTKRSSYWTAIFMINLYSCLGFFRMYQLAFTGLAKTKLERMRKDTRDIIAMNEITLKLHNSWMPLQETIANAYLIAKRKEDIQLEGVINKLIITNTAKSRIISDLTKSSEFIINELGCRMGWKFLVELALHASSPDLFKDLLKFKPQNFEEIRMSKKYAMEQSDKYFEENPLYGDPTARFTDMIEVAKADIEEIKKSLKNGIAPKSLSLDIASKCGHDIIPIQDQTNLLIDQMNLLTSEQVMPDMERRVWHAQEEKYLRVFQVITKQDFPTFWFIVDKNSGKIIGSKHNITDTQKELEAYLHLNIKKDQFIMSLESGEDLINCFDNKSSICPSDCKSCIWYNTIKTTKKLYQIMNEFSYDDLRREALNINRMIDDVLK